MISPPFEPFPGSVAEKARFHELQGRLVGHHGRFSADHTLPYTAVVVPSQSVDPVELAKIPGVGHYEERALFNLMLLRHPRLRMVFVTSKRLDPVVVDYYLHQLRGVPSDHARRRLILLDADDASARPLTTKILERPRLLQRLRESIIDPDLAHLSVFNSTGLERTLSVQLGIPLNACDPDLVRHGSKTGSRRAFAAAGVPMAPGREGLRDARDVAGAIAELQAEDPSLRRVVVKLNDSFSGEGNALLDLSRIPDGPGDLPARIEAALPSLRFEAPGLTWPAYSAQLRQMGGVVEAWLEGKGKRSPSVQLRINPSRLVDPISTHDQVLGGPNGQVFMGATFPADEAYRLQIQGAAVAVGRVLAARGVVGRFAVDFLVLPKAGGEHAITAVEINLRQGGTTHPFNTLKFLTDGRYDPTTGSFYTAQERPRAYFATDALTAPEYKGILPFDLIDALVLRGMHFRADETGAVFHLLGCLSEYGKLGCTAISGSVAEAQALYAQVQGVLDEVSGRKK